MTRWLSSIMRNARLGRGPCEGCSAHETSDGAFVNPGLGNPDGELVFVTEEPRHPTDWSAYDTWEEYNDEWFPRFTESHGGDFISRLLAPSSCSIDDVWIADSIKCPTTRDEDRAIPGADTDDAYDHCRPYLAAEFDAVDPKGIISLGKAATVRTLDVLGIPRSEARRVRVSTEYGRSPYETSPPVVISLHWAQRTVHEEEWVPRVQEGIDELV